MKFFAKLVLVALLVPAVLIVLIASTIKFQLLSPDFWKTNFKTNNIYTSLSESLKTAAENQTEKGGGKKSDLKVITDIITPEILEDFVSRNIDNFLGFVNGIKKDLIVYIPITKIPKEFAPKSVGLNSEEIPFTAFLSKFNIGVGNIPISQIAYLGMSINYLLIGSVSLTILFILLLFLLTKNGSRFISIGIPFVLTGFLTLLLVKIIDSIQMGTGKIIASNIRIDQVILKTITPSVLQEISKVWLVAGIVFLILGVTSFFFKKPQGNNI